jgi:phosphocarrier protein FPr
VVGLVVVSHSARLAEGVAELAAQMAGPEVRIGAAGGLDEPAGALGTDAVRVLAAIEDVWSDDGVLVLMDLGSAVLSAELAMDLLEEERRGRVLLTAAPLVEGAVAAAVAAGLGDPLETVAAAARDGLAAKREHIDEPAADHGDRRLVSDATGTAPESRPSAATLTTHVTVRNRLGLHARPAALLVRTLAPLDARVTLAVPARGRGPADARSITAVGSLGVCCGEDLAVSASGAEAEAAVAAVHRLADEGFGEPDDLVEPNNLVEPSATSPAAPEAAAGEPALAAADGTALAPAAAGSVLAGVSAAPGLAFGPARLLHRTPAPSARVATDDPDAEWRALDAAREEVAEDLRRSRAALEGRVGPSEAAIFDAHLLLVDDPGLLEPAHEAVFGRGEPAGRAWADAVARAAAAWDTLDEPYQRARAADVRDVGEQVLRRLAQGGAPEELLTRGSEPRGGQSETEETEAPCVVVTGELTPADVAGFAPGAVAGVASARGGPTAHAVILASALGVPVVVGAGERLLQVEEGADLLVDGDVGTVTVRPAEDELAKLEGRRRAREREAAAAAVLAAEPAVTRDGVTIAVEANVGLPAEAEAAVSAGADGVGLLRTEFLFLDAAELPDEDEQAAAYAAVAAALQGQPLTIRTLDAGADKPLPALPLAPERNPFLGVRGLRLGLLHPDQLRCQLRAVLHVAAAHPVRVMLPMVAEADELRWALEVLSDARAELAARGVTLPERLEVGVMLEVPSAALLAEQLAPLADFFSVGTNDLTQYTLAAERGNAGVAALADPLHPAVLRLIERAAAAALAAGRTVAVCGEAAGDPAAVPLLLGLGVRELSMSPVRIAAAKQAVRSTDLAAARLLAERALAAESAAAVRRLLAAATPSG